MLAKGEWACGLGARACPKFKVLLSLYFSTSPVRCAMQDRNGDRRNSVVRCAGGGSLLNWQQKTRRESDLMRCTTDMRHQRGKRQAWCGFAEEQRQPPGLQVMQVTSGSHREGRRPGAPKNCLSISQGSTLLGNKKTLDAVGCGEVPDGLEESDAQSRFKLPGYEIWTWSSADIMLLGV